MSLNFRAVTFCTMIALFFVAGSLTSAGQGYSINGKHPPGWVPNYNAPPRPQVNVQRSVTIVTPSIRVYRRPSQPRYAAPLAPNYVPSVAHGYPVAPGYVPPQVDLTAEKASRLGFVGVMVLGTGFEVTDLAADGAAAYAGLQIGDVLVAANGIPLRSMHDAMRAIQTAPGVLVLDVVDANTGLAARRVVRF